MTPLQRRMVTAGVLLGTTAMWPMPSSAGQGGTGIHVGADRLVSTTGPELPLVEPQLAVDPHDHDHLLVAAVAVAPPAGNGFASSCSVWASFDAGASWVRNDIPLEQCGDPWVAINADGSGVFSALGNQGGNQPGVALWRSIDGGRTWSGNPVVQPGPYDHPSLAVDPGNGSGSGSLWLVSAMPRRTAGEGPAGVEFTLTVARSADGGRSFGPTTYVVPGNLSAEALTPGVLSDGTLVVPFIDHDTKDGRRLERKRVWIMASTDTGASFSEPMFVTESCTRSRPASWPTLAVDHSAGPDRDRLHLACEAQDFEDILVTTSATRGETWSVPIRIGHEGIRNPCTKTPAVAVSDDGILGVAWYDGRRSSFHQCHEIYFAASVDAGRSFLPAVRVSTEPSCPYADANRDAGWRWPGGGDYFGMVSVGGRDFRLVWADARTGIYQLRTAHVHVGPGNAGG